MGKEDDEGKSSSSCNWHSQRQVIVLAGLGGILAATVVVITISVVLQPPHIGFTVERATVGSNDHHDPCLKLTVKIAKNTTSGGNVHAKVKYKSVLIYLETRSALNATATVETSYETTLLGQPAPTGYLIGTAEVIINATVLLVGNSQLSDLADRVAHKVGVTVVILAKVGFQIGVVKTGWYYMTVSRSGVVFEADNITGC